MIDLVTDQSTQSTNQWMCWSEIWHTIYSYYTPSSKKGILSLKYARKAVDTLPI